MNQNKKSILGIDVGASGIKGAIVNVETGAFESERIRLEMPQPSTPQAAGETLNEIVKRLNYSGKIGVGFPSVVKNGIASTAANLDKAWIGCNVEEVLSQVTGCEVIVINDADAAGLAEMRFGQGKDGIKGSALLITIGTGLGTALFTDGKLVRNTEFGHILLKNGMIAEHYAASSAQKREGLSFKKWGKRFNEYLKLVELYLQPEIIILGGGSSKYFEEFKEKITIKTPVVPAKTLNNAGIIGAAMYAYEL